MDYNQTIDYLYTHLPMYQRIGAAAYRKDLTNIKALCKVLKQPQNQLRTIHIAGTNGKGSVSHGLASILQQAGYKTGLYTSPHLIDFRERIRIDGQMIDRKTVVEFVELIKNDIKQIDASFFEITTAMAFYYFEQQKVDIAVIETGLGGRLDSTNIITPLLSLITNISLDHQNLLGDTLQLIAGEKAGIIKPGVPAIISQTQPEVQAIFERKAAHEQAPLLFADQHYLAELAAVPGPEDEAQQLTPQEAKKSPHRNVITRAVGNRDYVQVDTGLSKLKKADKYLLCSDGLHGYLRESDIAPIANLGGEEAVKKFIALANERGGKDNITAILVEID